MIRSSYCPIITNFEVLHINDIFLAFCRLAVGRRSLTLVVFIGGVTFAEIAALRFLSSQVQLLHLFSFSFGYLYI